MFGNEEKFRPIIHQLLHEIVNTTLQMCAQLNSANQLSDKTDVLEGFFSMLTHIYKKTPHVIFSSGIDTAALFECGWYYLVWGFFRSVIGIHVVFFLFSLALVCLSLPEIQTLKLCSSFLVNFITQSRDTAQASVVHNYGEGLVLRILINLGW